jgi:DNA polymerase III epsilon subunit family exonuclease
VGCQSAVKLLFTKLPDNLVFLDIETTGLDPEKGAKIVEIAMLKVCGGIEERYESLVNPGQLIPLECSKIHAICDDMVKNSPSFDEIAVDVLFFIGHSVIVCHNAPFDLLFIHRELYRAGVPEINVRYIDTLKLARPYFNFDSNKLGNIANSIGVEAESKHRAMADVLTMFSVSKYIFASMYRKNIDMIEPSVYKYNPNKKSCVFNR